jgi:hypothetical protein
MLIRVYISPPFQGLALAISLGAILSAPNAFGATNASASLPPDQLRQKYGLFVHYVWGGADKTITVNRDGSKPTGLQDVANRFDAAGFARDVKSMGVEYVIFTAWHANMNLLYPCASMDKWIPEPDHTAERDVIQALLDELRPLGIRLYLYMHPQDGHDFTAAEQAATGFNEPADNYRVWNDFINAVYRESIARYGAQVAGYWIDCCTIKTNNHANIVDFERLRGTFQAANPEAVVIETSHYGALWGIRFGHILSKEINDPGWFDFQPVTWDINSWPGYDYHVAVVQAPTWWASTSMTSTNGTKKTPEDMFRYTVLQAGANTRGLGVAWAAGPYPGGGWEPQVRESMQALGRLIEPVAASIKDVCASKAYATAPGTRLGGLPWGVATRSADGKYEFIHVLKAPDSMTLELPAPKDGSRFKKARLLRDGAKVKLSQHPGTGAVSLTLPKKARWDRLDTVIRLDVEVQRAAR